MKDICFEIGEIVITSTANEVLSEFEVFLAIEKHKRCDYGMLSDEDKALNNETIMAGEGRIMSAYDSADGSYRFWVITDRIGTEEVVTTTILLPNDY